jgi:protein-disulfide isomerase
LYREGQQQMNRNSFATLVTTVLATTALSLTAVNARNAFFPALTAPDEWVDHWESFAKGDCRIGPEDAVVTVIVFADYQCPFCAVLAKELDAIQTKYPADVAAVWRHLPLERYDSSYPAARAALCAADQRRFDAFHRTLIDERENLDSRQWDTMAKTAGVADTTRFRMCLEGDSVDTILNHDIADGDRLGVLARPTLLIGSARYNGVPPDLERIVRKEIKRGTLEHSVGTP